jgi:arylsulfatase A-like enzyme
MWTAFLAPHFSFGPRESDDPRSMRTPVPAPRDRNKFASEPLPTPPGFGEKNVRDKPAPVRAYPRMTLRKRAAIQENYQQELETIQDVDRAAGHVVDALARAGVLDRTMIVFTSDNGYYHGEHDIPREKTLPYDPAIRVPLVIRGPGIPRGIHLDQLVSNQDLAPTFVDVAGARAGLAEDGLSLMRLMRHRHVEPGRDLLIEGVYQVRPAVAFSGIRTRQWFYMEYSDGERELYDLIADRGETRNRDGDPRYAPIERDLRRRLAALRRCRGAGCRVHPRLQPVVGYSERIRPGRPPCADSSLTVGVRGPDSARVDQLDLYANGRLIKGGGRGQRSLAISRSALPRGAVTLRPTAYLADDRAFTMLARVRVCGGAGFGVPPELLRGLGAR